MVIYFREEDHSYFSSETGERFTSVSNVFSNYKQPFDAHGVSFRKAAVDMIGSSKVKLLEGIHGKGTEKFEMAVLDLVDPTEIMMKADAYKNQWSDFANQGTKFHKKKEEESYERGYEINPADGKKYPVIKIDIHPDWDNQSAPDPYNLKPGYYPEMIFHYKELKIAGMSDKVFIGDGWIDIGDFKTDKEITTSGYKGKRLYYPLDHMQDCKISQYMMKISLYGWMAEQWGYEVRNLSLTHCPINRETLELKSDPVRYELVYKKNDVEQMLDHWSKNFS